MLTLRRFFGTTVGTVAWLLTFAPLAHAHGGIPDAGDFGPPVFLAITLGLTCYWTIMLWPLRK